MKNIIKAFPILFLLTFVGCNDLSEEVYSDLTVEDYSYSDEDIYNVIAPVYTNLRTGLWGWNQYSTLEGCCTDMLVLPNNTNGWDAGGTFKTMHQHTWTAGLDHINSLWNWLYRGVMHTNRIINQLETKAIPIPSDENYEAFIAEMKTARAFYYWLLIDNFGDVPFVASTSQEIPSVTARATIYEAIIADLLESIDQLSSDNNKEMYGRFNKWGAKAVLANLYLNAGVYTGTAAYDKCLAQCEDIIASGKYNLEYNYTDCFKEYNENSVETIFAIPNDEVYTSNTGDGSGLYLNATLHESSQDKYNLKTTPWGCGAIKAVPQFVETYDLDDIRLDATWDHGLQFAYDGVTPLLCRYDRAGEQLNYTKEIQSGIYTLEDEGYRITKYKPRSAPSRETGADFILNNDIPFFRYAQVLLMKAECLLRSGQADAAATIVSQVRERAFRDHPEKATVTGAELMGDSKYKWGYYSTNYAMVNNALEKGAADQTPVEYGGLYDELGWEFACEVSFRRRDMIRFGTYTTKSWLSHKPNGAYRSLYPIPQRAVDANPNLEQNSNY